LKQVVDMGYERLGKGPGMARAQHKGARHTGGYPLSTPSTGSTLSTIDLFPLITL